MSIYELNMLQIATELLPPHKRKPRTLAFMGVSASSFQLLHDVFFSHYAQLSNAPVWNRYGSYTNGDLVLNTDNAVYLLYDQDAIRSQPFPVGMANPRGNPEAWVKISSDYRGARERARYSGQKLILEFVLNQYFRTTFRQPDDVATPTPSDIYIEQNTPVSFNFIAADDESASFAIDNHLFSNRYVIDNSSAASFVSRTIFVPDSGSSPRPGWFTTLNSDGQGERKIRSVADRYNIAGVLYDIQTY